MRIHIELDDSLVARIDQVAGPRQRSRFVREAVRAALDQQERWERIAGAAGAIADTGHGWDEDPAAWVHAQRFADSDRVG